MLKVKMHKQFKVWVYILLAGFLFSGKIYAEEAADAPKTEKDRWKSSAGISYVTVSGNSDSQTLSITGDANRKGENNELELKAGTVYGKSDGEKVSEYWYGNAKYNHDIDKKTYLFGLAGIEGNKLAGYNYRLSIYPGVGYRFLEGTHELKGELGPGYVYEDRLGDSNLSYLSGRAYAKYIFHITKQADFSQDGEYLHDFSNADNYRVNATTALTFKVSEWISFKTGVEVKYVNDPPDDNENTDVFTGTSLIFTF
jgi:putative salt-induced outer membrane protein YdiY